MAIDATRSTIFSHHGDSSSATTEPRAEHFREHISTSDRDLVMMTMKLKLKKNMRSHGSKLRGELKFSLEKLRDTEVADLFEATIECKYAALNLLEENKDNLTEGTRRVLVATASEAEALGKAMMKKAPWMTNDIRDLCHRRRSLEKRRTEGSLAMQK